MLAGHDAPDRGALELDGVDTRRADLAEVRESGWRSCPGGLFEGTVLDNVAVGRPWVGPEQVRAALSRTGLFEAVRALPEGLDTPLGASGHPLSFDQQVQLLVARAVAGRPRLVVVDDFFDALAPRARSGCVDALTRGGEHTLVAVCSDSGSELARRCTRLDEERDP
ncbi:MAG: ABC transporter ATP-binding protein [Archangiaceae bacterium]|nr:ABC transporter ATP-binding protein [Archangiaceae bacterium]